MPDNILAPGRDASGRVVDAHPIVGKSSKSKRQKTAPGGVPSAGNTHISRVVVEVKLNK